MKIIYIPLLLLFFGGIGFVSEPWLFPDTPSDTAHEAFGTPQRNTAPLKNSEKSLTSSFSFIQDKTKDNKLKNDQPLPQQAHNDQVTQIPSSQKPPSLPDPASEPTPAPPAPIIPEPEAKPNFSVLTLKLDRYDKSSPTGSPELDQAIRFAIQQKHFEGLHQLLETELYAPVRGTKEIKRESLLSLCANPTWTHALNVYTFLQHFSLSQLGQRATLNSESEQFYYWLLTTPQTLTQLLHNLTPQDDLVKALDIWQGIWSSETKPEYRTKYLNLALACSLVFDKGEIKPKTGYEKITVSDRYTLFRKNAEAKRLKTVLSNMTVSDLVWVVDVPLADSEIEWALRHANFSRRNWGKAYGHIEYLMERAVEGENPYKEYTLAEIQKRGGICGDQTYFSVNTAKANGIPAAGVTGSGDRGGHAWLAYKPDKHTWNTETGRYEKYSNGQAFNSQTNQTISEFDFILMSDRKMKENQVLKAKTLLRLIPVLTTKGHDQIGIRNTIDQALAITPLLPEAWMARIAFLSSAKPETTPTEWKKTIDTIERTFKKHPSMWLIARSLTQKHLWKDYTKDDILKTQSRYRKEIARKFPTRGDIIRTVITEQAKLIFEEEKFEDVRSFYNKTFRLFGEDSLNFTHISQLYFECGAKFSDNRKTICDDIEKYFSRLIDEKSGDYFKATTEISMLRMISDNYRKIGEEKKADRIEKEAARRLKTSSKRAL